MTDYNAVLDELKSTFEAGFTVGTRKLLGTTPGDGVFVVPDFRGTDMAFEVDTDYSPRDEVILGPAVLFHSFTPSPFNVVGGRKNLYQLTAEIVINEQCKTVNGIEREGAALARHFYNEFEDGMNQIASQMNTVSKFRVLGGDPQDGVVGNTNLYGATVNLEVFF